MRLIEEVTPTNEPAIPVIVEVEPEDSLDSLFFPEPKPEPKPEVTITINAK